MPAKKKTVTLKEFRKEQKLTQVALAKALDVSDSTISAIEGGKANVSQELADKIKALYGINVAVTKPAAKAEKAPAKKAAEAEAPAKRKPGRPRKKAVEAPAEAVVEAAIEEAVIEAAVEEAAVEAVVEAVIEEAAAAPAAQVIIQSPLGGVITPEEILARVGQVDQVYVRVDQNKAYWVRGEEGGSVDLW